MGMVRHFVICQFKAGTTEAVINDLIAKILAMKGTIPGIVGIEAGPYESPEGMNKGFTHGFLVTFESPAARDIYLPHPNHEVVRDALLPHLQEVIAFDFEIRSQLTA